MALAYSVRDRMLARWVRTVETYAAHDVKVACYLSAEFLMGPQLGKNLVNLGIEAWDAAGLYHVGAFPGMAWTEWNGRYRDTMRRFVRGDPGLVGEVATRVAGSADLYADDGRLPGNGVNFITCHDGFTLHDLVSYTAKRNQANGQDNRDGTDDDASWNCGIEGKTSDPAVLALRRRQAKNCVAVLMLSRGVPMLLAGDQMLRSQGGNNNAWCQDSALSWIDWTLVESNRDMVRFTRELIALRRRHACDTSQSPPQDIIARGRQNPYAATFYSVSARSVVVLEARP